MIDDLLKVASFFDWISPAAAFAQDIINGPSHTFLIPRQCGKSGGEIVTLLRGHGIGTWGHMTVNGHYMITVRNSQAEFAAYLLKREGLPSGMPQQAPPKQIRMKTRLGKKVRNKND